MDPRCPATAMAISWAQGRPTNELPGRKIAAPDADVLGGDVAGKGAARNAARERSARLPIAAYRSVKTILPRAA